MPWEPDSGKGLYLTQVSIFFYFESVLTQARTGDQVFIQGIAQSDTLRGSDENTWVKLKSIFDTHPTLECTPNGYQGQSWGYYCAYPRFSKTLNELILMYIVLKKFN
jgi:hypothetical protein